MVKFGGRGGARTGGGSRGGRFGGGRRYYFWSLILIYLDLSLEDSREIDNLAVVTEEEVVLWAKEEVATDLAAIDHPSEEVVVTANKEAAEEEVALMVLVVETSDVA